MTGTRERWELLQEVADRLEDAGVPTPDVDARWIVDAVLERLGPDLSSCDRLVLDALVDRRASREPLQLVVGSTTFRWVEVACRPGVFIPRPETEVVADEAIEAARAATERAGEALVVEVCTGTGAIALAVASEVAAVHVWAGDLSAEAVALARENARALAAGDPPTPWRPGPWMAPGATVEVHRSDLLAAVPPSWRDSVDVLVANPPYLPDAESGTWAPEVTDHDPAAALVGGPDGHEVVDALLGHAIEWLRPGGTVVVEIDDRRGADAVATATAAGLVDVRLRADLTGRDRAVVARRPSSSGSAGPAGADRSTP